MPERKAGANPLAPTPTGTADGRLDTHPDFSTSRDLAQFARQALFVAALAWLARGFKLVPLQPGEKRIIRGWGPAQRTITTEQEARLWFLRNVCNLGVVLAPGFFCADFDDRDTMRAWRAGPGADVRAFVEKTARGFHVFISGEIPRGLAGPGLELKAPGQVVMSAPSVGTDGTIYTWFSGQWPPDEADWRAAFLPLLSVRPERPPMTATTTARPTRSGSDLVAKIKRNFSVIDELKAAGVSTWHRGGPETLVALCPFHDDHAPSLWARPALGIWGCNVPTCPAHGTLDVINVRAINRGLSVGEAIRQLARELPGGQ